MYGSHNTGESAASTVCSAAQARPFAALLIAGIVTVCSLPYLVAPITKDCEGDKLALAADNSVSWDTPKGEAGAVIINPPANRKVCVTPLSKEQAAAYASNKAAAWVDFNRFTHSG